MKAKPGESAEHRLGDDEFYLTPNFAPADDDRTFLKPDEMGLIVSPISIDPHKVDGEPISDSRMSVSHKPSSSALRRYLLFWDKLDLPTSVVDHKTSREIEFLRSEGALIRTSQRMVLKFHGELAQPEYRVTDDVDALARARFETFQRHENAEPGRWALAMSGPFERLPSSEMEDGRGLLFRLHQAIPVPTRDVPLDDVLQFRQRRRAELLALRAALAAIYTSIADAPDKPLSQHLEFEKLNRALADLLTTTKGVPVRFLPANFEVTINAQSLNAGLAAIGASTASSMSPAHALLIGAATTAVASLKVTWGLKRHFASSDPYRYAVYCQNEI